MKSPSPAHPSLPSQPVTTPPPPLPTELLEDIVSILHTQELGRFLQSSRFFYLLAAPFLYQSVVIDLSDSIHPLSHLSQNAKLSERSPMTPTAPAPRYDIYPYEESCAGTEPVIRMRRNISMRFRNSRERLENLQRTRRSDTISSSGCLSPLPDRLTFTTHLTLTSHRQFECSSFPPLLMPNLETLRIRPYTWGPANLQVCNHTYSTPQGARQSRYACPLLAELYPKELVMGDITNGLHGTAHGIWRFPKRVTIIVGMYHGDGYDSEGSDDCGACGATTCRNDPQNSFLSSLPDTVDMLTLVSASWAGGFRQDRIEDSCVHIPFAEIEIPSTDPYLDPDTNIERGSRLESLSWACTGAPKKIEVVGFDNCTKEDVSEIRSRIRRYSSTWERTSKEISESSKGVTFIKGNAYGRRYTGGGMEEMEETNDEEEEEEEEASEMDYDYRSRVPTVRLCGAGRDKGDRGISEVSEPVVERVLNDEDKKGCEVVKRATLSDILYALDRYPYPAGVEHDEDWCGWSTTEL